ncbi:MAG: TlyA family RNA methyltransferase [Candidatus Promineifilaceae bacterium]|nr:TlyA family RNA methyltransferase [Candidatus Promineifilaceae bacterium]
MAGEVGQVSKGQKVRLDKLLLDRGLVKSRNRGQRLIMAGEVLVGGHRAVKPSELVNVDANIEIVTPLPYVSRGGLKLAAALETFEIAVEDCVCADVGACTGGFSDVMLQRGARRVYAIDVGYGQLDWKLRQDPRIVIMERTNARYLESLPEPIHFVGVDVSFISLRIVLPAVRKWLALSADIVALVKPQFEAGPANVGAGGVVRDPDVHQQVLREILDWSKENGLWPVGLIESPVKGASGNREFLIRLRSEPDDLPRVNEYEIARVVVGRD